MNLISKIISLVAFVLSLTALSATKEQITIEAYNVIYAHTLTSVKGECLAFEIDPSPRDYYLIYVRENHKRPECGDANVSPKMFDIRINKGDGRIYTNQGSDPDDFRELPALSNSRNLPEQTAAGHH